jgi:hypothetical protein
MRLYVRSGIPAFEGTGQPLGVELGENVVRGPSSTVLRPQMSP